MSLNTNNYEHCPRCNHLKALRADCEFCGVHAQKILPKRTTCSKCGYSMTIGKQCYICEYRLKGINL